MFERKVNGILTTLEIKELKKLKRLHKNLTIQLNDRIANFKSGKYNGTMDITTYTNDTIELYNKSNKPKEIKLKSLNDTILALEAQL